METIPAYRLSPQQKIGWEHQNKKRLGWNKLSFTIVGIDTDDIVERLKSELMLHDPFRTNFVLREDIGQPVQVIGTTLNCSVRVGVDTHDYELNRVNISMNLTSPSVYRVEIAIPSFSADKFSLLLLATRLSVRFNTTAVLPQGDEVSYLQFSEWLNQNLTEKKENNTLYEHVPIQPLSFVRPSKPSFGDVGTLAADFELPIQTTRAKETITDRAFFATAFASAVWMFSGKQSGRIGYACNFRQYDQLRSTVGLLATSLPLQVPVEESSVPLGLGDSVEQAITVLEENKLEYLVSLGKIGPLPYQFEFIELRSDEIPVYGETLGNIVCTTHNEPFMIRLTVIKKSSSFQLQLEYDKDSLVTAGVQIFFDVLRRILDRMSTSPDKSIKEYDLMDGQQKAETIERLKQAEPDKTSPTIQQMFTGAINAGGASVAIKAEDGVLTWIELNQRVMQLVTRLVEAGVRKDDFVGLACNYSIDLVVAMLAVIKCRACYIPIDLNNPANRVNTILSSINLKTIVTVSELIDKLAAPGRSFVCVDDVHAFNPVDIQSGGLQDNVYGIFTSGTTGVPKGIPIMNGSLANYVSWFKQRFKIDNTDKTILLTSYAYDLGYTALWGGLLSGASLHLLPYDLMRDPEYIVNYIIHEGITFLKLSPSVFTALMSAPNYKMLSESKIRLVLFGGEAINVDHIHSLHTLKRGITFVNHYGPTETTIGAIAHVIDLDSIGEFAHKPVIGKPILRSDVSILVDHNIVPDGVDGEICISGPGLSSGYLNAEELTRSKFVPHPLYPSVMMYRTGDKGLKHVDGSIQFKGRIDEQVKIRGYRVELNEIKAAILLLQNVQEAVVVMSEEYGDLVAYFKSNRELILSDFHEHLNAYLPEYMIPRYFVPVRKLPFNSNGKLDKKALPDPADFALEAQAVYIAPRTSLEEILSQIWSEVLQVKQVGICDNFFDLGGNSLKAIQIVQRLKERTGIKIKLARLFATPTVGDIAKGHETGKEISQVVEDTIYPIEECEYYKISSAQRRLWIVDQMQGQSTFYHSFGCSEIKGDVVFEQLHSSIYTLVERNEILRTKIITVQGEPVQKIAPLRSDLPMRYIDMSGDAGDDAIQRTCLREIEKPFNLEMDILFRVLLIKKADGNFIFLLVIHHIITDGWSTDILINDIVEFYNGRRKEKSPDLQYKDYSSWQTRIINTTAFKKAKDYWTSRFTPTATRLQLPLDYKRAEIRSTRGSRISFTLDARQRDCLYTLQKRGEASLFMVLVALLKTVLFRYSNQTDIVVGTPTAGRLSQSLENQIGFYVNTLPLRTRFESSASFLDLIKHVKETVLGALEHEVFPFERLVEELNEKADFSHHPIFDVNIVLQNQNTSILFGGEIKHITTSDWIVKNYELAFQSNKFDLMFEFEEFDGVVQTSIEYNLDLFKETTIIKIRDTFCDVLDIVSTNHQTTLQDVRRMSLNGERMANEFKKLAQIQDSAGNIMDLVKMQTQTGSQRIAIADDRFTLTYGELMNRTKRFSRFLSGINKERNLVALLMENSTNAIISILSVLDSGCGYVPLDAKTPFDRLKYIIDDAKASTLIFSESCTVTANKLQWECLGLTNIICVDVNRFADAQEEFGELMNGELWDFVGEKATDAITGGGWVSSFNGRPFTKEEMDEYARNVATKVKPLLTPTSRVLEIGCSSGITLLEIAPHVEHYVGIDLSSKILELTKKEVERQGLTNVELHHLRADQLDKLEGGSRFDVIIINSVIQSFSGLNYLRRVVSNAIDHMQSKGVLFLGDIQDLDKKNEMLNEVIQASALAEPGTTVKLDWSNELFLSRSFIDDLASEFPVIVKITHSPKIGNIENELKKFRFDSIIEIDKSASVVPRKKRRYQFGLDQINAGVEFDKEFNARLDDPAYVVYTSGSTGRPKGVVITHRALMNYATWAKNFYNTDGALDMPLFTSLAFDLTVTSIFATLLQGGRITIHRDKQDIEKTLRDVFMGSSSCIKLTPSHVDIIGEMNIGTTEVTSVILGGEQVEPRHIDILMSLNNQMRVFNEYGPTEFTVGVSVNELSKDKETYNIGRPISGCSMYVVDNEGMICPIGMKGELWLCGNSIARGYLNRPVLTAEKFVKHPAIDTRLLYRTGDVARELPDGTFEFFGRMDDQVKIRGFRVELAEIEKLVQGCAGVVATAVFVAHENIVCFINRHGNTNTKDIEAQLKIMLPDYMMPSRVIPVSSFPLTVNGKIDREALLRQASTKESIKDGTPTEKSIYNIWVELLKSTEFSWTDSFFKVGGHSLKATQLKSRLYQVLGVDISIRDIFLNPSIRKLASLIDQNVARKFKAILSVKESDHYPMSHAQKRLWLLDQQEKNMIAYNMVDCYELESPFDRKAFALAFEKLCERHESLRTIFTIRMGSPVQIVVPFEKFHVQLGTVLVENDDEKEDNLRNIIRIEKSRPFDLQKGPLVRATIVEYDGEHLLLICQHHIISDGWSSKVLRNDLLTLYNDLRAGMALSLKPLGIQYKDYSAWHSEQLSGKTLKNLKMYWSEVLRNPLPRLNLSTDFKRTDKRTFEGGKYKFRLSEKLSGKVKCHVEDQKVTMFMFLVTTVKALLYSYTGDEDIIVGSPVAGRNHPDIENQIGFYVNTLPLRTRVADADRFVDLLNKVKQNVLAAFEHQEYPFDLMVDDLDVPQEAGRSPIFDVQVALQNYRDKVEPANSLRKRDVFESVRNDLNMDVSIFDLSFIFHEEDSGLSLVLEFNSNLFNKSRMPEIFTHFETLLTCVLNEPEVAMKDVKIF